MDPYVVYDPNEKQSPWIELKIVDRKISFAGEIITDKNTVLTNVRVDIPLTLKFADYENEILSLETSGCPTKGYPHDLIKNLMPKKAFGEHLIFSPDAYTNCWRYLGGFNSSYVVINKFIYYASMSDEWGKVQGSFDYKFEYTPYQP